MKVVVYTKPGCGKCMFLMKSLDSKGVEYEKINVLEDEEAMKKVQEAGYRALPVVEIDGEIVFNDYDEAKVEKYFN